MKPKRLAEKLVQIRTALGLSQNELIRELETDLTQNRISEYETGKGEPHLPVLLDYARLANIWMDVLVDDELDLPARIPSPTKSEGVRRKTAPRTKKR